MKIYVEGGQAFGENGLPFPDGEYETNGNATPTAYHPDDRYKAKAEQLLNDIKEGRGVQIHIPSETSREAQRAHHVLDRLSSHKVPGVPDNMRYSHTVDFKLPTEQEYDRGVAKIMSGPFVVNPADATPEQIEEFKRKMAEAAASGQPVLIDPTNWPVVKAEHLVTDRGAIRAEAQRVIAEAYNDIKGYIIRETNEYALFRFPIEIGSALDLNDEALLERFVAVERTTAPSSILGQRQLDVLAVKRPGAMPDLYTDTPPVAVMDKICIAFRNHIATSSQPLTAIVISNAQARHLDNELAQSVPAPYIMSLLGMKIIRQDAGWVGGIPGPTDQVMITTLGRGEITELVSYKPKQLEQ